MTTTLHTSQETPREAHADAVIIGVTAGPGRAALAPGAEDVDAALGGTLAQTLGTLGATGKAEEVTRIASGGQLTAPLIVAVGLGEYGRGNGRAASDGHDHGDGEALRRAAGRGRARAGPGPGPADRAGAARSRPGGGRGGGPGRPARQLRLRPVPERRDPRQAWS